MPSSDSHYDSLDGVRAVAAFSVVVAHYCKDVDLFWPGLLYLGQIGVMVFFVLSGFLMMAITDSRRANWLGVQDYLVRRLSRVLPMFAFAVVATYVYQTVARQLGFSSYILAFNILRDPVVMLQNLLLIRGDEIFWTIGIEIFFYVIFPVLWWSRNRSLPCFLLVILGLLLFQKITAYDYPSMPAFLRLNQHLHYFLFGTLTYVAFRKIGRGTCRPQAWNVIFLVSIMLITVGMPASLSALLGNDYFQHFRNFWTQDYLLWIAIPAFVLSALYAPIGKLVLGSPPLVFLGAISYSVYLIHRIPLRAFRALDYSSDFEKILVFVFLVSPIVIGLSWLSYRFVENPSRRKLNEMYNDHRSSKPTIEASG